MHVNSPADDGHQLATRQRAERYLPLLPIGGAMFMLSALVYYRLRHDSLEVRSPLQVLVAWSYETFGLAPGILGCVLLLTWGSIWFVNGRCERVGSRLARIAAMVVLLGVFFNLGENGVTPTFHKGTLGAYLAGTLADVVGVYPSIVLVWAMTVASLLLATDFGFREEWERLRANRTAPSEAGVEDEVAEVLKGLGGPAAAPLRAAVVATSVAATDDWSAGGEIDRGTAASPGLEPIESAMVGSAGTFAGRDRRDDDDEVDVQPEDPVEVPAPPRSRRSYFERRYAQPISESVPDPEWPLAIPENQEIDNPEVDAAEPVASPAADARPADVEAGADADVEVAVEADAAVDTDAGSEAVDASDRTGLPANGVAGDGDDLSAAESAGSAAAAAGLAQRGLFDPPLPAPRAPAGGWIAATALPAEDSGEAPAEESAEEPAEDPAEELTAAAAAAPREARAEGADESAAAGENAGFADDEVLILEEERESDESGDFADDAAEVELDEPLPVASTRETVVPIPRPAAGAGRAPELAEALVAEAIDVVVGSGRASATLLQRKLRLDFPAAQELLDELARRGVVELGADRAHGRVLR